MNSPLREVNDIQVRRTRSKIGSNDKEIIGKMVSSVKNAVSKEKKHKVIERIIADEKENSPQPVRRSKRTVTESVASLKVPNTSKSAKNAQVKKPVSKKVKGENKSKKGHSVKKDLNQTQLLFPIVEKEVTDAKPNDKVSEDVCEQESQIKATMATSTCSVVTEDSGFGSLQSQLSSPNYSIAVFNSPDVRSTMVTPSISEHSILTTDTPPASYWKELAEERRLALERTLYENEMLHDQLEVLEAENQQLKQLVKEAEDLAQVVRDFIK